MAKYEIEFSYNIPYWGDVDLEATDAAEARSFALREIERMYPESIDISIDNVKEINV